jgi:hypothetical protein
LSAHESCGDGADFSDLGEGFRPPLRWGDVPAGEAAKEWERLRHWVHQLVFRFDLDSHVVPGCWWRHNHLVEALVALRDHERACYAPTAAASAAVEFHRALRDIQAVLRTWVADLRCDQAHDPSHDRPRKLPGDGWNDWVAADILRRRQVGMAPTTAGPGPVEDREVADGSRHPGP